MRTALGNRLILCVSDRAGLYSIDFNNEMQDYEEDNGPRSRSPSPNHSLIELRPLAYEEPNNQSNYLLEDLQTNEIGDESLLFTPNSGKRLLLECEGFINLNICNDGPGNISQNAINYEQNYENVQNPEISALVPEDDIDAEFENSAEKLISELSTSSCNVSSEIPAAANGSGISTNEINPETKPKRVRDPATRREINRKKYPLLAPCKPTCIKKCSTLLSEEQRLEIYEQFWCLDIQRRRDFISRHVKKQKVSVKYSKTNKRNNTMKWTLADHTICKTMFLHTLGYKHDAVVFCVLRANYKSGLPNTSASVAAAPDLRGKHKPPHAFSDDYVSEIKEFIESCRPMRSHYNVDHAPKRRYFPIGYKEQDVFKLMNEAFVEKDLRRCGWSSFRKILKEMNISGCQPSQDLCTKCKTHDVTHPRTTDPDHDCVDCQCTECKGFPQHKLDSEISRAHLSADEKLAKESNGKIVICTADMQKVINIPKMTMKDAFFSRKLVLYNETYAPPGKNQTAVVNLWHEEQAGRKAHNIATSLIIYAKKYCRDAERLILYMDNCSAQNKNRILYSALFRLVNDPNTSLNSIKIEYLVPGHTYMAADSVHGSITTKLNKSGDLYDLDDFVKVIKSSRKNLIAEVLGHKDFIVFKDELKKMFPKGWNISTHKIIEFNRGIDHLLAKNAYSQEEFKKLHILNTNLKKDIFSSDLNLENLPRQTEPSGISQAKKTDLMKLAASMPNTRKAFFIDLIVNTDISE